VEKTKPIKNGFSLIELLISLLLITITFLSLCKIIFFSLEEIKVSSLKLRLENSCKNEKNQLLSLNFNSKRLNCVETTFIRNNIIFNLKIRDIGNSLKEILLTAKYKGYHFKQRFFKSKLVGGLRNE